MLMDAAGRLRTAPALEQSYVAGMPQLGLYGLSENWLLKECGHLHWLSIARARGQDEPEFADAAGHKSYAALTAVHLRDARLDRVGEHTRFALAVRAHAPGRAQHYSRQTLLTGGARQVTVDMLSAFIRREQAGNNRSIVKAPMDDDHETADDGNLADAALSLQARARLFRAGQCVPRMGLSPGAGALHSVTLTPCPHGDFNGAGLLYFASFQSLADRAELALCGHQPARTVERELYFYGNIDPGESVAVELLAQRDSGEGSEGAEFAHWWRLRRVADGCRIADLITRKRRVG